MHAVHPPVHPASHPSHFVCIHLDIHPSIHPSVHTSVRPSIHPSICPSVHPSILASFVRPFRCWGIIFPRVPSIFFPLSLIFFVAFNLFRGVFRRCFFSFYLQTIPYPFSFLLRVFLRSSFLRQARSSRPGLEILW